MVAPGVVFGATVGAVYYYLFQSQQSPDTPSLATYSPLTLWDTLLSSALGNSQQTPQEQQLPPEPKQDQPLAPQQEEDQTKQPKEQQEQEQQKQQELQEPQKLREQQEPQEPQKLLEPQELQEQEDRLEEQKTQQIPILNQEQQEVPIFQQEQIAEKLTELSKEKYYNADSPEEKSTNNTTSESNNKLNDNKEVALNNANTDTESSDANISNIQNILISSLSPEEMASALIINDVIEDHTEIGDTNLNNEYNNNVNPDKAELVNIANNENNEENNKNNENNNESNTCKENKDKHSTKKQLELLSSWTKSTQRRLEVIEILSQILAESQHSTLEPFPEKEVLSSILTAIQYIDQHAATTPADPTSCLPPILNYGFEEELDKVDKGVLKRLNVLLKEVEEVQAHRKEVHTANLKEMALHMLEFEKQEATRLKYDIDQLREQLEARYEEVLNKRKQEGELIYQQLITEYQSQLDVMQEFFQVTQAAEIDDLRDHTAEAHDFYAEKYQQLVDEYREQTDNLILNRFAKVREDISQLLDHNLDLSTQAENLKEQLLDLSWVIAKHTSVSSEILQLTNGFVLLKKSANSSEPWTNYSEISRIIQVDPFLTALVQCVPTEMLLNR